MTQFKVEGLQDAVKPFATKELSHPDVGIKPIVVKGTYNRSFDFKGVKLTFAINADSQIEVFNTLSDMDQDGILGKQVNEGTSTTKVKLNPQLTLTEEDAWLKYRLEAGIRGSVQSEFSVLGFKIDGRLNAILSDYRVHRRDETTLEALTHDIVDLRTAASLEDIARLRPKEALSYQVRGQLATSVTLTWADVFSTNLNQLSQLLKTGTLLSIETSVGASVTFNVGVSDDFKLVFTRAGQETIRVAVLKANSRKTGVEAAVQVAVKFADEAAVETALNMLVIRLAGETFQRIDGLLEQNRLTEQETKIIEALVKALNLNDFDGNIGELKNRWETFKTRVTQTIKTIAHAKIEAGFKYEYLRVRKEATLLQAVFQQDDLAGFHPDLMQCDVRSCLDWIRSNPNRVTLEQYLHESTLKRKHAWGFTLGIDPWKISGRDKFIEKQVIQEDIAGNQCIAYKGMRGYSAQLINDKVSWMVDFKADMDRFAANKVPTTCEFDYGLHFRWQWDEKRLTEDELREYLDYAVVWQIIDLEDVESIIADHRTRLVHREQATVSVELKIDNVALRRLLPFAATANQDQISKALAKAMPIFKDVQARTILERKERLYAPLWKLYLNRPDLSVREYARTAQNFLETVSGGKEISGFEGPAMFANGGTPHPLTFAGQIFLNGSTSQSGVSSGIAQKWVKFAHGLTTLNDALVPGHCQPWPLIEEIFEDLEPFWSQTLLVRAAGIYLLDWALENPAIKNRIERTLTLSFTDQKEVVYSVSTGAPHG